MERQHCTQYFSYINSYKSKTINKVSRQKIMSDHRHQWTNSFSHVGYRGIFNPKRAQGRGTSLSQIAHGSQIQGFLGWRWTLGHFHPQNLSANVVFSILCGIEISVGFNPGCAEASEQKIWLQNNYFAGHSLCKDGKTLYTGKKSKLVLWFLKTESQFFHHPAWLFEFNGSPFSPQFRLFVFQLLIFIVLNLKLFATNL